MESNSDIKLINDINSKEEKDKIEIYEKKDDFFDEKCGENIKRIYPDGRYYIGKIKNNLRDGKGIIYDKNGKIKYEGEFENDKF